MERETAQKELEELEALVASEGWRLFSEHCQADWGPAAYRRAVQAALGLVPSSQRANEEANRTVLQIEASAREVEKIVGWPASRIRELRAKLEQPAPANPYARTHY